MKSTDRMSGVLRNSMNPAAGNAMRSSLNPNAMYFANNQSNIKKSIRGGAGGAGSMYQKRGANHSVNLDHSLSARGFSMAVPQEK